MSLSTSLPSRGRRVVAASCLLMGFLATLLVHSLRQHQVVSGALWGALPNFLVGAAVPFAILIGPRSFRWREFQLFAALVVGGLILYECAQLVLPRRVFDPLDLVATLAGGLLALAAGRGFFAAAAPVPPPTPEGTSRTP